MCAEEQREGLREQGQEGGWRPGSLESFRVWVHSRIFLGSEYTCSLRFLSHVHILSHSEVAVNEFLFF